MYSGRWEKPKQVGEADDKNTYINEEFGKYITDSYVVDFQGNKVETDAFEVMLTLNAEIRKPQEERNYPVFVYSENGGPKKYVLPVRGKGLWGPIWGYIALEEDLNTIYGAVFDHKGETPGLGAEINTDWFQAPFAGKTMFDENGKFVSIEVVKGGADPSNPHQVDAISGGTITSKGLEAMIQDCLAGYVAYFKELANELRRYMSTEKEPLFSAKNLKLLSEPMGMSNPDHRPGAGNLFCTGGNC